jgi:hypothetical protein
MSQNRVDEICGCDLVLWKLECAGSKTRDENMKNMKKLKMVAVVSCLMAASVYTAQAVVDLTGNVLWVGTGVPSGYTVAVSYTVSSAALGVGPFLYSYTITDNAPVGDPLNSFEVNLFPGTSGTITAISQPSMGGGFNYGNEIYWTAGSLVPGAGGSATVSFTSTLGPGLNSGSALDDGPGPWGPATPAQYIAAPTAVPEPATAVAAALLAIPFGAGTLQTLRKRRAV